MTTLARPRLRASGPTALPTLAATGRATLNEAIADVLAAQSLPATEERPYLRAYSFVRHGRVPVTAADGRRSHLPARHVTLLRAETPHLDARGGAYYARVVVPEWNEERLYGPSLDPNVVAADLDRDHVSDLRRAKAPLAHA